MIVKLYVVIAGVLGAVAVALGAIGAHALQDKLTAPHLEAYRSAVLYQILHCLGLLLVALLYQARPNTALAVSGGLMLAGIGLFSGCIYLWLATGLRPLMFLVPLGGTSFILAWLALALGGL